MGLRLDRFIHLRKQKGFTQYDLADELGLNQNQISRYENGTANPTLENLKRLAALFDTSSDYLLGLSDQPYPDIAPAPDLSPAEAEMVALMREYDPAAQARLVEAFKLLHISKPKA